MKKFEWKPGMHLVGEIMKMGADGKLYRPPPGKNIFNAEELVFAGTRRRHLQTRPDAPRADTLRLGFLRRITQQQIEQTFSLHPPLGRQMTPPLLPQPVPPPRRGCAERRRSWDGHRVCASFTRTTHSFSADETALRYRSFIMNWLPKLAVFVWIATRIPFSRYCASTSVPGAFLIVGVASHPRSDNSAAT